MLSVAHRKQYAFTLVELLVVIAVIAVLAAILFPVFATVREKARQTSCVSNERQIGAAFEQYLQDYDEFYPAGYDSTPLGCGWAGEIYPYVKSEGIFHCPSDGSLPGTGGTTAISYAYNCVIPSPSGSTYHGNQSVSTNFTAPGNTILLFEIYGYGGTPSKDPDYDTSNPQGNSSPSGDGADLYYYFNSLGYTSWGSYYATGFLGGRGNVQDFTGPYFQTQNPARHTGGSNYLLCDGHAKWVLGDQVSSGLEAGTSMDVQTTNLAEGTETGGHTITFSPI